MISERLNPVIRKDLLGLMRLRSVAWLQIGSIALLASVVVLAWPKSGVMSLAARLDDNLVLGLLMVQLVLLMLAIPAIAAVALTIERERGTLELLFASRLTPARLVIGKVGAIVTLPFLLMASFLPFVALLAWRGGVDLPALAAAYGIIIATSVMLGVAGLAISACCETSISALLWTYLVILGWALAALVPATLMLDSVSGSAAAVLHYARALSPVAAVLSLLRPNPGDFDGAAHGLRPLWVIFFPAAGSVIAASLVILFRRLSDARKVISGALDRPASPKSRRLFIRPMIRMRPWEIGQTNSLLAKERRTNPLGSVLWTARVLYGAACASLFLAIMALYGGVDRPDLLNFVIRVLIVFQFAVIALIAPGLTAAAITRERELATFELLRASPLPAWRILIYKIAPVVPSLMMAVAAFAPAYVVLCYINPSYVLPLLRLLPVMIGACAICGLAGMACSTFAGSTPRAAAISYMAVAIWLVAPPAILWMLGGLDGGNVIAVLSLGSPVVIGTSIVNAAVSWVSTPMWAIHLALLALALMIVGAVAYIRLAALLRRG